MTATEIVFLVIIFSLLGVSVGMFFLGKKYGVKRFTEKYPVGMRMSIYINEDGVPDYSMQFVPGFSEKKYVFCEISTSKQFEKLCEGDANGST